MTHVPGNGDDQFYWDGAADGHLLFQRCAKCGDVQFPPRRHCARCWSDDLEHMKSDGTGTIESITIVRRAPFPAFRNRVPYAVVAVRIDEGPRMITNLVDEGALTATIGDRVVVTFRRGADDVVLPQFRLAEPA